MSAKPSHRAYAAKGQGSAGPVRRRRKTGTLYVIPSSGAPSRGGEELPGVYN